MSNHEYAVIATLISQPKKIAQVQLKASDFQDDTCRQVFGNIRNSLAKGREIDPAELIGYWDDKEKAVEYFSQIADYASLVKPDQLKGHVDEIKSLSNKKSLESLLSDARYRLHSGISEPHEIVKEIKEFGLSTEGFSISTVEDINYSLVDKFEEYFKGKGYGYTSGLKELDEMILGLSNGLHFVGARTNMGKTTFLLYWAYCLANQGARVWFLSLEDAPDEAVEKLIACRCGKDTHALRKGIIDRETLYQHQGEISNVPLMFSSKRLTASELRTEIDIRKDEVDIIFIDQLSKMKHKGYDKRESYDETIAELYDIQMEYKKPIVVAAQVNRGVESRDNKRPNKSDFKETGFIEESADTVIMIYRDVYYNPEANPDITELIICKNKKSDKTGTVIMKKTDTGFVTMKKGGLPC